jgi:hypothetical protein
MRRREGCEAMEGMNKCMKQKSNKRKVGRKRGRLKEGTAVKKERERHKEEEGN